MENGEFLTQILKLQMKIYQNYTKQLYKITTHCDTLSNLYMDLFLKNKHGTHPFIIHIFTKKISESFAQNTRQNRQPFNKILNENYNEELQIHLFSIII